MKNILLVVAAASTIALSGCVIKIDEDFSDYESHNGSHSSWQHQQKQNKDYISKLALGVDSGKVQMALGSPDFTEAFKTDNGNVSVLFYRTHHQESDSKTTKDECTPLVFMNDELVGWGDSAIRKFL